MNPGNKPCIVIADDERPILDVMRMKLQNAGFDIHLADNGDDALDLIQKLSPVLAILDYQMPGLNGFEVAKRLCLDKATASIPVIGISSKWDGGGSNMIDVPNVREFIHKPFSPRKLVTMVDRLVGVNETD